MIIAELKKGSRFSFNDETYIVTRKYIDDDRPLVARNEETNITHHFHWEGLEINPAPPQPHAATVTAKGDE